MFQLMRLLLVFVVFVGVLGCGFEGLSSGQQPQVVGPPSEDGAQLAARTKAVIAIADQALQLDDSLKTRQVAKMVMLCAGTIETCMNNAAAMTGTSPVGAAAGLAANLARRAGPGMPLEMNEKFLREGEKLAKKAVEEAQRGLDARQAQADGQKAEAEKAKVEQDKLAVAATACEGNLLGCKAKCDGGDAASCFTLGGKLFEAGKLVEARAVLTKGCAGGMQAACAEQKKLEGVLKQLWDNVEEVGDDLAQKKYQEAFARQHARPTARTRAALGRMGEYNEAVVLEKFCPAKREFVKAAGASEYTKSSAWHCKERPPTGTGLTGAEVALTQQCSEVYATACP